MGRKIFPDQADPNSEDDFERSGPSFWEESIDWENTDHKRSVASSLVNGVYILERQRREKCQATQVLASLWWESFGFTLIKKLADDKGRIFGAVFIYQGKDSTNGCPRCVIAFRGTLISSASDIHKIFSFMKNTLHRRSRFQRAMEAVRYWVALIGASNVWLTGHSLGAAIGMLVGKTMAKEGSFLEAFLFNPPFFSIPIELIRNEILKFGLHLGSTLLKGLLSPFARGCRSERHLFVAISGWIPRLFVNQRDFICNGYIGYFKSRKKMEKMGLGAIARFDSRHSLANLAMKMTGIKGVETAEPQHLLPSANLTVNRNPSRDCLEAHQLRQWWTPQLRLECNVYEYKKRAK